MKSSFKIFKKKVFLGGLYQDRRIVPYKHSWYDGRERCEDFSFMTYVSRLMTASGPFRSAIRRATLLAISFGRMAKASR